MLNPDTQASPRSTPSPSPLPQISMNDCALLICERYSINLKQLRSPFRGKTLVRPRHLCAALCRDLTGQSWHIIRLFLARTSNNAIVNAWRRAHVLYPEELAELKEELRKRAARRAGIGP